MKKTMSINHLDLSFSKNYIFHDLVFYKKICKDLYCFELSIHFLPTYRGAELGTDTKK